MQAFDENKQSVKYICRISYSYEWHDIFYDGVSEMSRSDVIRKLNKTGNQKEWEIFSASEEKKSEGKI